MKRWTLDTRLALGFGGMGLAMAALLAVILFRSPPDRGLFTLLAVGTAVVGTVGVLAWLMVRKELTRLALGLSAEIEAFSETYNQVLTGCRDSAKDARKQEEALQEAAASLEEVTAMTRRNTKHALEASQLADETRSATERGVNDIHAMGDAIAALSSSSGEIARILKVIDGVALQTNLLALNAAVEAARAGERGAGFAVVADEVRNLAQRAAVAARDSGSRIEETLNWISQCEILKGEVVNSLDQIANRTRQLAELAAGVSEATGQQATSVTQASAAFERCDRSSGEDVAGTQADNGIVRACLTRSHTLRQSTQALLGFLGLTIPSNPVLRRSPSSPGRDRSGTRPPPPHHSGGKSTPGSPHLSAAKLEESLSCGDPSSAQSAPNN